MGVYIYVYTCIHIHFYMYICFCVLARFFFWAGWAVVFGPAQLPPVPVCFVRMFKVMMSNMPAMNIDLA